MGPNSLKNVINFQNTLKIAVKTGIISNGSLSLKLPMQALVA